METKTEPQAWVGCLGCYNEGALVGKWLDDPDEMREYRCPRPKTIYNMHEELWVFDHEGVGAFIKGECSPMEFADLMEWIDDLDYAVEAVAAYCDNTGTSWRELADGDMDDFEAAYLGEYDSITEYLEAEVMPEFIEANGLDDMSMPFGIGSVASHLDVDFLAHNLDCSGWHVINGHLFGG